MSNKIKIAVVGLGGVGGFYGGLLANYYANSEEVEVNFLVRGENLQAIKKEGIKVHSKEDIIIGKPHIATSKASEIGVVDYILLCTKAYDLDGAIALIKDMIGEHTVILPLLNGVSAFEELKIKLPNVEIWQGCTYIVSRLAQPGVVQNPSGRQKVFFGLKNVASKQMLEFQNILYKAGIKAKATESIETEVWEKYILVSSSAMATSYFDCSIGDVMQHHTSEIKALVEEATSIAKAKEIKLSDSASQLVIERLEAIPYESTTSMHSDFKANKTENELVVMGWYMLKQGTDFRIKVPFYKKMYDELKFRKSTY